MILVRVVVSGWLLYVWCVRVMCACVGLAVWSTCAVRERACLPETHGVAITLRTREGREALRLCTH